jgi:exodeoxyribonuclease V alpha subunit
MSKLPDWVQQGSRSSWLGRYEIQLLNFLSDEYHTFDEDAMIAVVFLSLFTKAGHICLPLNVSIQEWSMLLSLEISELDSKRVIRCDNLLESDAFGRPDEKVPFVIEDNQLFIRRDWLTEQFVAKALKRISSEKLEIPGDDKISELKESFFSNLPAEPDWQKVAMALALQNRLLVISGGPGTGKTTTVAQIISYLLYVFGRNFRIALTAPTGKAAARMTQALKFKNAGRKVTGSLRFGWPDKAMTLHRLLNRFDDRGILPDLEQKKLPYDLIVVDEASMVDLKLMGRLLMHLSEDTRLILLGDKDQLSSVEAGSVLADICHKYENKFSENTVNYLKQIGFRDIPETDSGDHLDDSILYLTRSFRFGSDSGIAALAESVNKLDVEKSEEIITGDKFKEITHIPFNYQPTDLQKLFSGIAEKIEQIPEKCDEELLQFWSYDTWLTAVRRGPFGSESLNKMIEDYLLRHHMITPESGWYHGRPILITRNDYTLDIYNGDAGVCVSTLNGTYKVLFTDSEGNLKYISPHRIQHFEPAFLITVHKSQGSEFNNVNLLLPEKDSQLLTRELIYTAVTRARNYFTVVGDIEILKKGIERKTERFTGLKSRLYPSG